MPGSLVGVGTDRASPARRPPVPTWMDPRRQVIGAQNDELRRPYDAHGISDTTRRRLRHDLDREEAGLRDP